MLLEQFQKWDVNNTGKITPEMLQERATRRGEDLSKEEANAIIAESDLAGDGVIKFSEYKYAMRKAVGTAIELEKESLSQLFASFDGDGDGLVTWWELQDITRALGCRLTRQRAEDLVSSVDKDEDGRISLNEFLSIPKIATLLSSRTWCTQLLCSSTGEQPLSRVTLREVGPFVTSAYGVLPDGTLVHRTGRRMRKRRSKIATLAIKYDASEFSLPLLGDVRISSSSGRIKYWEPPVIADDNFNPSVLLAICFLAGSLLFAEGSAIEAFLCRYPWQALTLEFWGVTIPYLFGSLLFDVGCWLLMVESLNIGYEQRLELWKRVEASKEANTSFSTVSASGASQTVVETDILDENASDSENAVYHGPYVQKPEWKWFGTDWQRLDFVGAWVFTFGAVCYTVLCITGLPVFSFEEPVHRSLQSLGVIGSNCFVLGSYLYWSEFNESWIPLYRPHRIAWWINLLNLLGSFAFLLSAICVFYDMEEGVRSFELIIGYFGGSVMFLGASYLLYLEAINPNDVEIDDLQVFH
ncbi:hypothetical protein CYMTET_40643 [Cymbomonas tetramitiformis]|uniref:EF-hand domain-containing protein n=1 Tax=Cymbomonas tetramitiformis TaxID=36881 RepID=A0AAE0F4E9_9CHLO|nr:hypothetical protein CYMTET_40643 [Cymbomonas tetramitiformis]